MSGCCQDPCEAYNTWRNAQNDFYPQNPRYLPPKGHPQAIFNFVPKHQQQEDNYYQCPPISKLAAFANGVGSLSNRPPPLRQSNCCPGPLRPPIPSNIPPALIQNQRRPSNQSPSQRLRNVDVVEELCYFTSPQKDDCCVFDYYNACNCCGAMDYLSSCSPKECEQVPKEPIKYVRRQRFNFADPSKRQGQVNQDPPPPWPFDDCSEGRDVGNQRNRNQNGGCCGPPYRTNSFDETPVGKNPVARPKPCCCCCCEDPEEKLEKECERKLPKVSGVYYFDRTRGEFVRHVPEVQIFEAPPHPPPPEEEEEDDDDPEPQILVQPIIQPMMMPNCCPNPNPFNPFSMCGAGMGMMGGGVMGGIGGIGGMGGCNPCGPSVVPMCIPMCNQYGLNCTQQQQPCTQFMPMPMRKMKKKKKKKKRREEPEEEEEEEEEPRHHHHNRRSTALPSPESVVTAITEEEGDETVTTIFIPNDAGDVDVLTREPTTHTIGGDFDDFTDSS